MRDPDPTTMSRPISLADIGDQKNNVVKDHQGKYSTMRIGFLTCLTIGGVLCLGGLMLSAFGKADGNIFATTGALLMGSSGFAKAIQSKAEKRK